MIAVVKFSAEQGGRINIAILVAGPLGRKKCFDHTTKKTENLKKNRKKSIRKLEFRYISGMYLMNVSL